MLAKTKLHTAQVLISKALKDSNISHGEFLLANNVLKDYDNIKEEIRNSNKKWICLVLSYNYYSFCICIIKITEKLYNDLIEPL